MEIQIRRVRTGDENALARIQTESWKAAFRGIMPDEILERCTELSNVTAMYRRMLEGGFGNGYILELDAEPHAIAYWDKTREEGLPGCAELICIHSLPENWRRGCGTQLMRRVLADIGQAGYESVMLWVFAENRRARSFYEKMGFAANGKTKNSFGAEEMCYERSL